MSKQRTERLLGCAQNWCLAVRQIMLLSSSCTLCSMSTNGLVLHINEDGMREIATAIITHLSAVRGTSPSFLLDDVSGQIERLRSRIHPTMK